jgi:SAM-dependent methyltransferase
MPASRSLRIALVSAVALFLEMLLVRWVGTEVRIFAYLQNAVLISTFLGLGLGCRNADRPVDFRAAALSLVAIGLFIRDPLGWRLGEAVTQGLAGFQDSAVWGAGVQGLDHERLLPIAVAAGVTLGLLCAVALVFPPLGQLLGRWMEEHPRPIAAYTINVLGSLAGIVLFDVLTLARTPPWVWLSLAALGLGLLLPWSRSGGLARGVALGGALALPFVGIAASAKGTIWSPYHKLGLSTLDVPSAAGTITCGEVVYVNNVEYQTILELDRARMARRPDVYPAAEVPYSHYVMPYTLIGPRRRALIVGSGAGNDVAGALEAGVGQVQAVEIDPAIVDLGRMRHPDQPYASPRVALAVDDARAFFRKNTGPYDLVWFGLLDSHTTPSAYSNVRLDHFVYTRESFADMKRLLAPSGVVVLLFEPQTAWIGDRLAGLFRETFGAPPLVFDVRSSTACLGWGGRMFVGGSPATTEALRRRAEADPGLARRMLDASAFTFQTEVTTDDWPYLYLARRAVPTFHLVVGGAGLLLAGILRKSLFTAREPVHLPMLLLGAGFMLLEVTAVSRAALLYGTTWKVNGYVVGAMLSMVLLANLVAARRRPSVMGWPLSGLALAILAIALVPTAWLASLPPAIRIVAGGTFLALPVFFSGVVFVLEWAGEPKRAAALGSNLIGSLLGGLATMLSMVVGFRALAFLTLAIYLGVWFLLRHRLALQRDR